jgi:cytoskeletal protein CcmA (bactofilin family)
MSGKYALRCIDTFIAQGCRVEGDVFFEGGLRIDGHVKGHVKGEIKLGATPLAHLVLGRSGQISGGVWADYVLIDGLVEGNLHITGRVELLSRARIIGNIYYESLRLQPGATVTGLLCPDVGNVGIPPRAVPDSAHELKLA